MSVSFSVLICTYNRHELLEKALRSLVEGTEEKPDELVVVNGGDERTDRVVESFVGKSSVEVRLIKTRNINLATSRNVGLKEVRGDIVAMTDDDAEVFPDWVTRMKDAHQRHPEAGAVGGLVLGTNQKSLVGLVADAITFPAWEKSRYVRTLPGVNISYKRDAVERIGPQDTTLFRGEDVDYNWRLLLLEKKIYFDPTIKVWHHHRPNLQGFLNQHYMYGRAYVLVRRKWPDMYCVYPRQLRKPKDLAKAINTVVGVVYLPFVQAGKVPGWSNRIQALPLLFLSAMYWRLGMVMQRLKYDKLEKANA